MCWQEEKDICEVARKAYIAGALEQRDIEIETAWKIMKTIEERATEYARIARNCEKCGEDDCLKENFRCDHFRRVYYAFINSANDQKKLTLEAFDKWLCENSWITRDENNRKPLAELRDIIETI